MQVRAWCPQCWTAIDFDTEEEIPGALHCPRCDHKRPVAPSESLLRDEIVDRCAVCSCRELFLEKGFDQRIGCGILLLAIALSPATYMLSLLVASLLDLVLYRWLPFRTVCYNCQTEYRGFAPNPRHEGYDLNTAEKYGAEAGKKKAGAKAGEKPKHGRPAGGGQS
ncbi:MAG: hypothetical protein HYZ53_06300 [Planctomycetes bacterium]|nr:hypothetical protein [Planctomycetota bacterium]